MQAAEASLAAAERQAAVELERRTAVMAQAARAVEAKRRALADDRANEREVDARIEAGRAVLLEQLEARLARMRAELELQVAQHDVLRARLDYLSYLGIPPSEVWK